MGGLGPFEPGPRLAVACSGGPDSMALLHLAIDWASAAGGSVTALVVDHRLRPGSTAEARQVADRARRAGAEAVLLTRRGARPAANLQAAARAARYRLLTDWCAKRGILHLLLGHHRDDQAETLLLRLARGSGVDGLAAMAPVVELPGLRLLRPVLGIPRARLQATLTGHGATAVSDPSNLDERFDRVRLRRMLPQLGGIGLEAAGLAATAGRLGRARSALEAETAQLLARAAEVYPEGYARVDGDVLRSAPAEIGLRAIARLVAAIGGRAHPPRLDRVERLHDSLSGGRLGGGRTIAGCRVKPVRGGLLVLREADGAVDAATAAGELTWDGRFRIRCRRSEHEVRRLGQHGWRQIVAEQPALRASAVPPLVRPSLPAVWGLEGVLEVPHLCYVRNPKRAGSGIVQEISFAPLRAIQATRFTTQ